jgi:hypothetical protein
MTITRDMGLVLTVCNNSKVPTFTKKIQTADELGIYKNRSLRRLKGMESKASTPTYKDQRKKWQNNKFKKKKKKKPTEQTNIGATDLSALAAPALSYPPTT